jgi:hypothetical protein
MWERWKKQRNGNVERKKEYYKMFFFTVSLSTASLQLRKFESVCYFVTHIVLGDTMEGHFVRAEKRDTTV